MKFQNDNAEIQEEIQVVLESKGTQTVQLQPFQEVVKKLSIWKFKSTVHKAYSLVIVKTRFQGRGVQHVFVFGMEWCRI